MNRLIFVFILLMCQVTFAAQLPVPKNLITLTSRNGEKLLYSSKYKNNFLSIMEHYETQGTQTYCGVASAVIALNTLNITPPLSSMYYPFNTFTQKNFFTLKVLKIKSVSVIMYEGLSGAELDKMVNTFPEVSAKWISADKLNVNTFKNLMLKLIDNRHVVILANFYRKSLGEEGGGHWSPLIAYNKNENRFLMLDVARYKYPPVWVSLKDLWAAIDTLDGKEKRGILVIRN